MLIPIRTDSPLRHTPYMNWTLIAANVLAYLAQLMVPGLRERFALYAHDPWWVAFITYAFLHGSPMHLVGNMLFLYIFGNNVNDKMGHLAYLGFYLAGAVFAGIGYVAVSGEAAVIGASGAVAAVTGAYLILFPRATVTVFYVIFFIGTAELSSFWFVALFFIKDLMGMSGPPSGIAFSAHVFGTLYGFLVCFGLLGAKVLPRDQFDVLALVRQWNRRRQYRDIVSQGYNPFDYAAAGGRGGRGGPPNLPDPQAQRLSELRAAVSDAVSRHDMQTAMQRFLELRAIDPKQVLSRQAQLDVANHLAGQQHFTEAAEAYEQFLVAYPKYEQIEQIQLMLAIVYARYLKRYARAKELLEAAIPRLFAERELELARAELARVAPLAAATATGMATAPTPSGPAHAGEYVPRRNIR
jgi:membrane associated rhomboid family serine protease